MVGLDVGYLEINLNKVKLQTKGKIINIQQKQLSKLKQINSAFGIFCKITDFVVQKLRFFQSSSILFMNFSKKFSKTTQAQSLISGPISNPDPGLNIFRSATTRTHTKQTEKLSKQSRHFTENVGKANTHDMTMFHDYFWVLIFKGQIVAEAAIP